MARAGARPPDLPALQRRAHEGARRRRDRPHHRVPRPAGRPRARRPEPRRAAGRRRGGRRRTR
ncbi:hypothetical protein FJ656_10745 [Schumannella luteola]|nr:hypothetical protein FJ656_10745 [Schumannella luteola]